MTKPYVHKIQYYETDKMQITHHSNYVRIMEEARIAYLEQIGYSFQRMESEGLISPVVSINVQFKRPTTFGDEVSIAVSLKEVTSAKLVFEYTMQCNNEVVCLASSVHCFVDGDGRPISLKRVSPDLYNLLLSLSTSTSNQS